MTPDSSSLVSSAQAHLQQLRAQIDAALQTLVDEMVALAGAERDAAIADALTVAQLESDAAIQDAIDRTRADVEADFAERLAATESQTPGGQGTEMLAAERAQAAEAVQRAEARAAQALADAQDRTRAGLADALVGERQCDLACMERLLDAVRALDEASSLTQVFDTLTGHAASHVARVAVLLVRGGEVRGWKVAGFTPEGGAASIAISLDGPTVVARAARTGERVTTTDGVDSADAGSAKPEEAAVPFGALPDDRVGLAVPIRVGDRTVAVLYADEGDAGEPTVPSAWPEALEILTRHAARCLERLTVARAYGLHPHPVDSQPAAERPSPGAAPSAELATEEASEAAVAAVMENEPTATGSAAAGMSHPPERTQEISEEEASALRYARLLISEIKLYHEDAVNQGRRNANLLERLGPEIARARRLYEERVPADVRSRADHFGQELVRTLANGDPRLLGQVT